MILIMDQAEDQHRYGKYQKASKEIFKSEM